MRSAASLNLLRFARDRRFNVSKPLYEIAPLAFHLSVASFASLPHLEISSSREDTGFIDRWLAEAGLARRIALRAPYLSAAPILVQSDLVATLSRRIAQEFVRNHPLQLREPPYLSPRVPTVMLWHRRLDRHPAHRWLRDGPLDHSPSACHS
jgi:DNA-binding transcriptional LysR family regulator